MDTTIPLSGPYGAVAALSVHPPLSPSNPPPRAVLEAEIERLISILDAFDAATEDLELDADFEPSLGAYCPGDLYDGELDDADREPSLGSLDRQIDQRLWNAGALDDCEEGDDDEPSLGWSNPMASRIVAWDLDKDGSSVPVLADDLRVRYPAGARP